MVVKSRAPIHFFFKDVPASLRNRKKLKDFLIFLFKREKKSLSSLNYIFCSDKFLLEINRAYLKHDYYTDVVSFNLSNPRTEVIGEIYISLQQVKNNADQFGQTFKKELHRIIFHGALHLCGYSDKTKEEQLQMRKKEEHYLRQYFNLVPRDTVS
jgi:probable rRNA maturation factor